MVMVVLRRIDKKAIGKRANSLVLKCWDGHVLFGYKRHGSGSMVLHALDATKSQ
jgi:hypothetical protein